MTKIKKPKFPAPNCGGYGSNGMRASFYNDKAVRKYAAERVAYALHLEQRKKQDFDYPAAFDRLMCEHFGEKFTTTWNLLSGSYGGYETKRTNGKRMTKAMLHVGRTISNSIAAGQGD